MAPDKERMARHGMAWHEMTVMTVMTEVRAGDGEE
jgi:hypothetical protein